LFVIVHFLKKKETNEEIEVYLQLKNKKNYFLIILS